MKEHPAMCLKTHGERMPENGSLAMLMKPNDLKSLSGNVDEQKGDANYELRTSTVPMLNRDILVSTSSAAS